MDDAMKALIARIVARDISDALDVAPQYSHQATFAIPYYQHQLVARVISGVLNHYFARQQGDATDPSVVIVYFMQESLAIETIIKESFTSILEENLNWTESACIPDSVPPLYKFYGFGKQHIT